MALDEDSAQFAVALNAAGAAYLASSSEHVGQRAAYSGVQGLASVTASAVDAVNATLL